MLRAVDISHHRSVQTRMIRRVQIALVRLSLKFCRVEVSGFENIPDNEAYLIAYNHISVNDAPILLAIWPTALEMLAAEDLDFAWGIPRRLTKLYRCILVHRERYPRPAMETVVATIKQGWSVAIAPEGRVSQHQGLLPGKNGISYAAHYSGARVLPVAIIGTQGMAHAAWRGKRPKAHIKIGNPITLPAIDATKKPLHVALTANTDCVMTEIHRLLVDINC